VPVAVPFKPCVRSRPPSTNKFAEPDLSRQWLTEQVGKLIEAEVLDCWFTWTFTDPVSDVLPQQLVEVSVTLALAALILPCALCEQVLREQRRDADGEPGAVPKSKYDDPTC